DYYDPILLKMGWRYIENYAPPDESRTYCRDRTRLSVSYYAEGYDWKYEISLFSSLVMGCNVP
ncbi:MAG: hypothetical protein ACT4QE_02180, partial [Anaerolineales bacterium]